MPLGWYVFGFGHFTQFVVAWFGSYFVVFLSLWTLDMRRMTTAMRRDLQTAEAGGMPDVTAAIGRARRARTAGTKLAATIGSFTVIAALTALFCVLPWQAMLIGLAPVLAILVPATFVTRNRLVALTMRFMAIMDTRVKALMANAAHPVVPVKPPPYVGPALSEIPALRTH